MTSLEPFFGPIPGDNPCGKDISYDPAFSDLETLAKGKQETQFSAAEDPNWREVQSSAVELLGKSKHLRLGILTTVALLQVEGLQGFANGLALLADWTKNHWDGLYPSLDPDDRNDPTERINLLQALSSQDVTGERILQRLANIPLAESPQLGRYSLKTILDSPGKPEIDAAFRDTDKQKLQLAHDAAGHAIAGLKMMQQTLMERVGPERSPNLRELDATLKQIQSRLAPYLSDGAAPGNSAEAAPSTSSTDTAQRSGSAPGTIASREDVVRALRAICAYYKSHEPASPIPLLLGRAERLVNKEFIDIITDLAPESMAQINLISGIRPDANK